MRARKKIEEYQKSAIPFKGSRSKKVAEKVAEETTIAASHKRLRSKKVAEKVAYQDSTMSHEIKTDKNMSEDMNMIRFEMLIDEVGKKLHGSGWNENYGSKRFPLLDYFFDPEKFNAYAKMIYDKSLYELSIDFSDCSHILGYDTPIVPRKNKDGEYDIRSMVRSMDFFVKNYNYRNQYEIIYNLLFWSFMILTVDDSQRDEALAKLSDFITLINNQKPTLPFIGFTKYLEPDSVFNKTNILYFISVIKYLYHYDNYKDVPDETDDDYSVSAILHRNMDTPTPQKYFQNRYLTEDVIKYIDE